MKMLQNEMFTFEIDSETALVVCTLALGTSGILTTSSGNPRKFRHGVYLVYTRYILLAFVILVYTRYMTGIWFLEKKCICILSNACMHAMITS